VGVGQAGGVANRLVIAVVGIAAVASVAVPGLASSSSAPAPGDAIIARAHDLAGKWGRCPTARPAARVLALAERTKAPRPRVRRARAALGAWKAVARDCAQPVAEPTVTP
jgi:hypothetical protein